MPFVTEEVFHKVEWQEFKYCHVFCRQKWNRQGSDQRRACWVFVYHTPSVASRPLGGLHGKRQNPQHPKFSADSQLLRSWCCGGRVHSVLSSVVCGQGASVRRLLQLHGEMLSCSPGGQGNWTLISTETGALTDFHSSQSSNCFFNAVVFTRCC